MGKARGEGAGEHGIHKALYGRVLGRRLQGRPRMGWVDHSRRMSFSWVFLRVSDRGATALNRGKWKY